jgi:cardiolipin synthase
MTLYQLEVTGALLLVAAEIWALLRAMLRPHREPDRASPGWWSSSCSRSSACWATCCWVKRCSAATGGGAARRSMPLPRPPGDMAAHCQVSQSPYAAPFALASTVNALEPGGGNAARLFTDSNAAIDGMIADIEAAQDTVHLCFYIWLPDNNGTRLAETMARAARRVRVRVLADALGSRLMTSSPLWRMMREAGVEALPALPVGNVLWTMLRGRVDLRNHRKVLVIDNRIAWCGSQNAADPEFRIKPRFAPWVDIMTRWEGPVTRQCQFLFASDWMAEGGDDVSPLLIDACEETDERPGDIIAQVIGTGPTLTYAAMTACFAELIHSARRELVISTPYFVPDEQLLYALLSTARRGVDTVLIVPARNDSRFVAAACRSYYHALLEAGVKIHEYRPGLLHAKTMAVDGQVTMIGSANLDRRSFELNYENNILFLDPALTSAIRATQDHWIAQSVPITAATWPDTACPAACGRTWRR